MSPDHTGYHFGDITKMVVAWFGPAAKAVRGKVDWLKFGKALVVGFLTTGTLTFASAGGALAGAITNPAWATAVPALIGLVVYVIEQVRRILQGQPPTPPSVASPEDISGLV